MKKLKKGIAVSTVVMTMVAVVCNFSLGEISYAAESGQLGKAVETGQAEQHKQTTDTGQAEDASKITDEKTDGTDDDEEFNDVSSALADLNFDTSEIPEDFDEEEAKKNPLGADTQTINEYGEIIMAYNDEGTSSITPHGTLYGHNTELDDNYSTFINSADNSGHSEIGTNENQSILTAAGDFKGTGRNSCVAYAAIQENPADKLELSLNIFDPQANTHSDPIVVKEGIYYDTVEDIVQNIFDIDTGDYDGDGIDEVAVLAPQNMESSSRDVATVYVYKLIDKKNSPTDKENWRLLWTYDLPKADKNTGGWNTVDIESGDLDKDGADDMILSWGRSGKFAKVLNNPFKNIESVPSKSVLLYGDKNGDMLQKSQQIDYGDHNLCRVAFKIGDLNSDGELDIVLGGQFLDDALEGENKTRCLGYYTYDQEAGTLVKETLQNMYIVDGVTDDEGEWQSNNGYDQYYYSMPSMKADITFAELYGKSESKCIYLDSVLYKYEDSFEIVDELDEGSLYGTTKENYFEYGADASNFAGAFTQGLVVNRVAKQTLNNCICYRDLIYPDRGIAGSEFKLKRKNLHTYDTYINLFGSFISAGSFMAVVDTDKDSSVMHYTGNCTMAYSDPKVLAVLASAPYFKDVAENAEGGEDIPAYSDTSWGQTSEKETSNGVEIGLTFTVVSGFSAGPFDTTINVEEENYYAYSHTVTKSFEINYSTVGGQDCVVFYSVPTAIYEYEVESQVENDNGEIVQKKEKEYIYIPYHPATQTIEMETYNDIQKDNSDLPDISNDVLTSECGDPSSYPRSTNGLKNATVYPEWATPAFDSGMSVTQSISETRSDSHSYSVGANFEMSFESDPLIGPITGFGFEIDTAYAGCTTTSNGTTASGTVQNMTSDAKGYGYYFSWRLMTYDVEDEKNGSFPVVTYMVTDVTTPPALPTDFRQDYEQTTDSQVGLKWSYSDSSISSFDIIKHNEFTEGSNDVRIGRIAANDYKLKKNKDGNLVYDEDGRPVREYTFVDTELSPYAEYEYRIQVNREKIPPKSIPSKTLKCKTRALFDPKISLSDTDLTVYYDTIKKVTVNVDPADSSLISNKSFQWQKYNSAADTWDDIALATENTYKFSKCEKKDEGRYRCRVNSEIQAFGVTYRITSYSETLNVEHSKRDVKFGKIETIEDKNKTTFIIPVTNAGDGARTQPQGRIIGILDNGITETEYSASIDPTTNTAAIEINDLESGVYELSTRYKGESKTFKDADNSETFIFLKNINSAKWLSVKKNYSYNEDLMSSLKLYEVYYNASGTMAKKDITDRITKVEILGRSDSAEYAAYSFKEGDTRAARIPCRYKNNDAAYNNTKMKVAAYIDGEIAASSNVNLTKGKATLYIGDIEDEAGAANIRVLPSDIKIRDAEGYKDGDSPFVTDPYTTTDLAFGSDHSDNFKVGVYTQAGEFIMYPESGSDLSSLNPGLYIIKPEIGRDGYKCTENDFFDISYEESKLILRGHMYHISATGEQINGKNVGSVSLATPDKVNDVTDLKYQAGTTLTFKANPALNYAVKYWVIKDLTGTSPDQIIESPTDTLTYTVSGQSTKLMIKAVFTLKESRLSLQTIGGGETSSIACTSDKLGDDPIIPQGKELTFKAVPANGYDFVEWRFVTIDGKTSVKKGTIENDGSSTVKFTMGESSGVIYAVFQRQKIDVELGEHLTAYYLNKSEYNAFMAEGNEVKIGSDMKVPAEATMIVRPEPGYKAVGGWDVTSDGKKVSYRYVESETAIKFDLSDAKSIKVEADCEPGSYSMTTADTVNASVDVCLNDSKESAEDLEHVKGGSTFELTARPDRGYVFKYWKINGTKIEKMGSVYAGVVTRNMSVEAICEKVEPFKIKTNIEGNGSADYTIQTASGNPVEGSITGTEAAEIDVYEGESITFNAIPAANRMTSYLVIDGERKEYHENSYSISDIKSDSQLTIGFDPAIYHRITVENNSDYGVETVDGRNVKDSITMGSDESFDLIITGVDSKDDLTVFYNDEVIEHVSCGSRSYKIHFDKLNKDGVLRLQDNRGKTYINNAEELLAYLKTEHNNDSVAILNNDIVAAPELFSGTDKKEFYGIFDGKGHSIYLSQGKTLGEIENFGGLFPIVSPGSVIRDLTIRNLSMTIVSDNNNYSDCTGLIAGINYGTIENCAVANVYIQDTADVNFGGIAGETNNIDGQSFIRNCLVKDFNIKMKSPDTAKAAAIAYSINSGNVISSCYVDNYKFGDSIQKQQIMVYKAEHISIDLNNCWYNCNDAAANDTLFSGNNIWIDGKKPDPGEIVMRLNEDDPSGAWGIWDADDTFPVPIASGYCAGKKPRSPYKVEFRHDGRNDIQYACYSVELPGYDSVKAWSDGTNCYECTTGEAARSVPITKNVTFRAVGEPEKDYGCLVKTGSDPGMYYTDLSDAVNDAIERSNRGTTMYITTDTEIKDYLELSNIYFAAVYVQNGATLTVNESATLELNTAISVKGATIVNYGNVQVNKPQSIINIPMIGLSDSADSPGWFINYGKVSHADALQPKTQVVCKNHSWGDIVTKVEPTTHSEGEGEIKCNACGKTRKVTLDRILEDKIPDDIADGKEEREIDKPQKPSGSALKSVALKAVSYTYTGKAIKPAVIVKSKSGALVKDSDYTVKYSNNKNVGTAKVVVAGKGKYTGTISKTFKINPKPATIRNPKAAKKALVAIWKIQQAKMSKSEITGYQVQVATNNAFTKNKKTATLKGYKKNSKKISGLRSRQKYYVRVRTYKTVSGKKYYSAWSKYKSIKVK